MNEAVIDLETSIKNTIGNMKASPHSSDNKIVMYGWFDGDIGCSTSKTFAGVAGAGFPFADMTKKGNGLLIGQNIKFDLLYIKTRFPNTYNDWVKSGGMVWDTMVAEYLITGQESQFASLDKLCEKYGGTLKNDKIKEYWDKGIDTEDIPENELREYLIEDLYNTALVYECQFEYMQREGMIPLMAAQMDALLALVEMESNGMYIDQDLHNTQALILRDIKTALEKDLIKKMKMFLPHEIMVDEINPASSKQVSAILFGGEIKVQKTEEMRDERGEFIRYKSGLKKGQIKTKTIRTDFNYTSPFTSDGDKLSVKTKNGWYSVDDKVLKKVNEKVYHGRSTFIEMLLKYREIHKDHNTYYVGLKELIFEDGCIHPNFNQTSTATGRLSSSGPNAQNINGRK